MIAITMSPGATTIIPRVTLPLLTAATTPPPAATSTSRNVPQVSANTRRHSSEESKKSSVNCLWTTGCCRAASGRFCLIDSMSCLVCTLCPRSASGHKPGSTPPNKKPQSTLFLLGQFLADRLQFQPTLLRGLRICHLEILQRIENDAGNNQPGVLLIIGGNGVPWRGMGAGCVQGILIRF